MTYIYIGSLIQPQGKLQFCQLLKMEAVLYEYARCRKTNMCVVFCLYWNLDLKKDRVEVFCLGGKMRGCKVRTQLRETVYINVTVKPMFLCK